MSSEFLPNILEAIYCESEINEHKGNPLIEALPPFVTSESMIGSFRNLPHFTTGERQLPAYLKLMAILRLSNYIEPLPPHFEIIDQINITIRNGYVYRNPNDSDHRKKLNARYRESMAGSNCAIGNITPSISPSFSLFGVSGVGKSTIIERTLSFFPQALYHRSTNILQIVYLKIDCPYDGSLKHLLISILTAIDKVLGTQYMLKIRTNRTIDDLILHVINITTLHHLGILVIDEIQNLLESSGVGQSKMLNFFVTFSNLVKIPLLIVGTPRSLDLLEGTFREARRVGDFGTFVWESMVPGEEWHYFLTCLWKYQWTLKIATFTPEMESLFYEKTQGIHALVVRLFQLSQMYAIREELDSITEEVIVTVYKEKFKLVAPMLDALRKGDPKAINKYEDLFSRCLDTLNKEIDTEVRLSILKEQKKSTNIQKNERLTTISALLAMGYQQDQVHALVDKLFNENFNISSNDAVIKLLTILSSEKNGNHESYLDLKSIISNGKSFGLNEYESLSIAGLTEKVNNGN